MLLSSYRNACVASKAALTVHPSSHRCSSEMQMMLLPPLHLLAFYRSVPEWLNPSLISCLLFRSSFSFSSAKPWMVESHSHSTSHGNGLRFFDLPANVLASGNNMIGQKKSWWHWPIHLCVRLSASHHLHAFVLSKLHPTAGWSIQVLLLEQSYRRSLQMICSS
jgi:hypothetical protein